MAKGGGIKFSKPGGGWGKVIPPPLKKIGFSSEPALSEMSFSTAPLVRASQETLPRFSRDIRKSGPIIIPKLYTW